METEDLDNLKRIKSWMDKLLNDAESLPSDLREAGLKTQGDFCAIIITNLESVYSEVKEKIENNEPVTATEQQERDWESDNNR